MLFYCPTKLLFNLSCLKLFNLLFDFGSHPIVLGIGVVDHAVCALFGFPCAAQHITTHSALEITQIAKSIVPAHRLHCGVTCAIGTLNCLIVLMSKKLIKITAVNTGIQQLIITYLTFGQGVPRHHAAAH